MTGRGKTRYNNIVSHDIVNDNHSSREIPDYETGGDEMRTDNVTVGELTVQMVVEAKRLGYSEVSIWHNWMPKIGIVAKYYREQGLCVYDPAVTDRFLQEIARRFEAGKVSANYFRKMRQIIKRLNEFYLTGTLRMNVTLHGTKYVLSSRNERLVDLFVVHQGYGENTRDDAVWAVRKYLCHFERLGHETLTTVTIDDVQRSQPFGRAAFVDQTAE